jgi:hypothetical protein
LEANPVAYLRLGEVAEWLNALLSKSSMLETASGVRIPPSPPLTVFIKGFINHQDKKYMLCLRKSLKIRRKPQESGLSKIHTIIAVLSAAVALIAIGTRAPVASPTTKSTKTRAAESNTPPNQRKDEPRIEILTAEEKAFLKSLSTSLTHNTTVEDLNTENEQIERLYMKLYRIRIESMLGHDASITELVANLQHEERARLQHNIRIALENVRLLDDRLKRLTVQQAGNEGEIEQRVPGPKLPVVNGKQRIPQLKRQIDSLTMLQGMYYADLLKRYMSEKLTEAQLESSKVIELGLKIMKLNIKILMYGGEVVPTAEGYSQHPPQPTLQPSQRSETASTSPQSATE